MEQKPKIHPAIAALIVIVLVGIVASVVIAVNANNDANKDTQNTPSNSQSSTSDSNEAATESTDTSTFKDGSYSATGSYLSPGGRESVDLTVTIKDGVITESSITTDAASNDSRRYQELFAENYKELVVGKEVNGLSLSRVAGSSLTSNGFNDALDEIRNEAKV